MSGCCSTLAGRFDSEYVSRELAARKKGRTGPTSSKLVDLLGAERIRSAEPPRARAPEDRGPAGAEGATLLDVGAGFGDIQTALFERGLAAATHVEASSAYSEAARELAREGGYANRVRFEVGDFLEISETLHEADIVTLDRVVCCYPDMPGLIDRSARLARHLYALSAPRDGWLVRLAIGIKNRIRRLRGDPFRTFV